MASSKQNTKIYVNKVEHNITDIREVNIHGKKFKVSDGLQGSRLNNFTDVTYNTLTELALTSDPYKITDYMGNISISECYKIITNSEKMNRAKKAGNIQRVKGLHNDVSVFNIVPNAQPSNIFNTLSYNRFMAIPIAAIRLNRTSHSYDWDKHEYVNKGPKVVEPGLDQGNKLALAIGMSPDHDYYWFYATGYEYTFDMFPIEVIATTIFRVKHREELKLTKMQNEDIVRATASQMFKKNANIKDLFEKLGVARIKTEYQKLCDNRTTSITVKKTTDFMNELENIFN
ncbi:putative nucleocapsid protein [Emaravirus cordylinae]|uniref:Putative nucleocapsid protein n=1 Tax=Emaravirus cordylinae TaxID=2099567 RepID=A0A513PVV6_9VIRU|nr:putative nucleocapsid protein [Emaravirus cordylinae]QAB47309.1 putative nucleocapsid protein [Emaravirus cordylinae]